MFLAKNKTGCTKLCSKYIGLSMFSMCKTIVFYVFNKNLTLIYSYLLFLLFSLGLGSCNLTKTEEPEAFYYTKFYFDDIEGQFSSVNTSLQPTFKIKFSVPVQPESAKSAVRLSDNGKNTELILSFEDGDSSIVAKPTAKLNFQTNYKFEVLPSLLSKKNTSFNSTVEATFTTPLDSTDKFERITDEALLTLVQKQTFTYFWDFGHPVSGLSRERDSSGDLVTSGGSGFGIMTIPVAIHRGFITRQEGLQRMIKMVDFLKNKAVTYHGVFPHWLNGATGATIPFSTKDNGGDLVETSYLMAGLLTARQFFDENTSEEITLRKNITELWEAVEWDWHTKNNENVLFWHWSPTYNWEMNHQIHGWNEALITYILAAASPTHPIKKEVYDNGWARKGAMKNGNTYYGFQLPLGEANGGPLFFEHYTFLGIDPRNLKDEYANYWQQAVNHTKINRAYCVANPRKYMGYSADCWGLTASDTYNGYSAHSPNNDLGVISPTAALSSFPYTPNESMQALRFFYYKLGNKTWKKYGFIDAFSLHRNWYASSFLAIDQGPIVCMIENHRSQLLWKLMMNDTDVQNGLKKLGFSY